MPEKIGLQAVLEDKNFQDGVKRYISGLGLMDSRTTAVTSSAGAAFGGLGGALITGAGAAIGIFAAQILPKLVGGLQQAVQMITDVGKEAIMTAARVDEMGIVVDYLGTQAGYTSAELGAYVAQLRDAGLMTNVAQKAVAEFTRYNLDLAKAHQLVAIAQGVAILAEEDSSETMQALIDATLTQNTLMLRRRGIVVDMGKVMEDYAKAHGKAADDLSDTERAQAALDAVILTGTPLIGLYDKAMESASKQLRSMPRYIYELLLAAGTPFQTTFKDAVFLLVDFVKGLTAAAREGGWLNVVLTELGSTIQGLTAPLLGYGRTLIDIFKDINLVFGSFQGPNLQALAGNIAAVQRQINELEAPDLASGWEKQADEVIKINRDLGASITGIWEDVNRAITQATQDRNTQLGREEQDWLRDRERDLADHRDSIAEMYEELEDRISEMQRDRREERAEADKRFKEDQAKALESHEEDMEDLRRDAGMAETKEEWDLIQELIAKKEGQFAEEQALAIKKHREEEAEAEKAFQAELRQERRRVKERVAIAQLEFDQKRAREEEDRQIRLQREEQDFQLRITRQNEEAARREADMKAAAAERTALLQAEIAAGKTAREEGYAQEKAALQAQLAAAKREYEKALFELPFLHEQHAKEAAKAYERLSELFAAQFGIEFGEIKQAWDEKDWGSLGLSALMAIWKLDWQVRSTISSTLRTWVGAIAIAAANAIVEKTSMISDQWVRTFETAIGNALAAVRSKVGDFWEAGWKAIYGFVQGFLWGEEWMKAVVRDVIAGAVQAALDALGIGSPSKVFLGIGQNLSASLAEGIRSMGHLPAFEMQRVAAGTMHSVTNNTSYQNNYSLSVHTSAPAEPILSDFRMMQTIAG